MIQKLEETVSDMIQTKRKMFIEYVEVKSDLGERDGPQQQQQQNKNSHSAAELNMQSKKFRFLGK